MVHLAQANSCELSNHKGCNLSTCNLPSKSHWFHFFIGGVARLTPLSLLDELLEMAGGQALYVVDHDVLRLGGAVNFYDLLYFWEV